MTVEIIEYMKAELVVLTLWLVAIVTSVLVVSNSSDFRYLGPVFAVCAIGSVVAVRRDRTKAP